MKCTQCGTELEGGCCPVCGRGAAQAESAGGARQGAAQPPQNAGQAAQSAPPQNAGQGAASPQSAEQNLAAQEARQGEGAASSALPSVTDAPPEKLPPPQKVFAGRVKNMER